jgi:CRP/FNR family transcriptional regulator, anaerobic regulatory protein
MQSDLSLLINHIRRFVALSEADIALLSQHCQICEIKNKEHVLKEGEVCRDKYFILRGVLRKYINTPAGDQQIFQFSIEDWWMTDYASLESGKPSQYNIQAVENCVLVRINKDSLEKLYREIPAMETYFRKILQRAYEATLWRVHVIFAYSGEERYRNFSSAFPDFVQRIPQYMLASYLGFTPEFLSKLRAKR